MKDWFRLYTKVMHFHIDSVSILTLLQRDILWLSQRICTQCYLRDGHWKTQFLPSEEWLLLVGLIVFKWEFHQRIRWMSLIPLINHNRIILHYVLWDSRSGLTVINLSISRWIRLKEIIWREQRITHVMECFMRLDMLALYYLI